MPGDFPENLPQWRQMKPTEVLTLPINFSERPAAGDTIASLVSETCVKEWGAGGQLAMASSALSAGLWTAKFSIGAAVAPSDHLVKVTVLSGAGERFEEPVIIEVRNP